MSNEGRVPAKVFNVEIGTMTGWDQVYSFAIILYDFIPSDYYPEIKAGHFMLDFDTGRTQITDDNGTVIQESDVFELCELMSARRNSLS